MKKQRIAIIGAGPSGISCAIQLKRFGFEPFLVEKDSVGGLLLQANCVENYPGFPGGISGAKLATYFKKQLEEYSIKVHSMEVCKLNTCNGGFLLDTNQGTIETEIAVIASGTEPKRMNVYTEDAAKNMFYDVRSLRTIKEKDIAIVGGGDAAFDYALGLSSNNSVRILVRKTTCSCLPLLYKRAEKNSRISIISKTSIKAIEENNGKLRLRIDANGDSCICVDYILFAIGREPSVSFLSGKLLSVFKNVTCVRNLYFIGDVVGGLHRQVGIAVGDGLRTAMEIHKEAKRR
ncbi:MAG: NAD(P)/FAD-dependent oxidoreductase [Candidatus Cloacimonadota bacterium]|nr:MAG: NAD(P)/FAD-dependent oxidoreductase [Candidatus Cloacimonadota bacterium]